MKVYAVDPKNWCTQTQLCVKGKELSTKEITSLYTWFMQRTINFGSTYTAWYQIKTKNGRTISYKASSPFICSQKVTATQSLYNYLEKLTFDQRTKAYLDTLFQNRFIDYNKMRIFLNGDIQQGRKIVNIRTASKKGEIERGIKRGRSYRYSSYNPNEIRLSDKRRNTISIKLQQDCDVIAALLEMIIANDFQDYSPAVPHSNRIAQ